MYYDYHVHTNLSADSGMGLELACRAAIKKGVAEMAVTDHLDIDYPDSSIQFELDYEAYSRAVCKAKKLYDGKLNIIKGIEIGLQPHVLDMCRGYLEDKDFEFIIASVHAAHRLDLHSGEFCAGKSQDAAYREYLEEVYKCVQSFELFNVIGHIDLIRRYGNYNTHTLCYRDYADILDMIMISLIDNGKGIEINTSGYRYGLNGTMPGLDLVTRYKELGGEVLTIGSDAHFPDQVAERFEVAYDVALKAGFKYITRFPGGKAQYVKLDNGTKLFWPR